MAQNICANDNVKGIGVQQSAVVGHPFIAQTHGHVDPRYGVDGPATPPILIATVLVFRILACFSSVMTTGDSVAPLSKTAL